MLFFGGLLGLAELCLVVYCLLDVIRTPSTHVRNLPKPVWLILCLVPPVLGPLAWLLLGRPPESPTRNLPYKGNRGALPEPYRPRRTAATSPPDDDEAFLRSLRSRAEEQRRQAEQQRRRRDESS